MSFLAFLHLPLAYIDPGTGSLILQVAIGAVVGLLVTMKLYWMRLQAFFRGRLSAGTETPTDTPPAE